MTESLSFIVHGRPQQQGSKRNVGRGIMIEANKNLAPWRDSAIHAARQAMQDHGEDLFPLTCPVTVLARFVFPRPKSHYGTGRNAGVVKSSAPSVHTSPPDGDKLARAVGDVLTQSGLILDDRLIWKWEATKEYGGAPKTGVLVTWHQITNTTRGRPVNGDPFEALDTDPASREIVRKYLAHMEELTEAWDEGYRKACSDHSGYDSCTTSDHGQRHVNPYRKGIDQ